MRLGTDTNLSHRMILIPLMREYTVITLLNVGHCAQQSAAIHRLGAVARSRIY